MSERRTPEQPAHEGRAPEDPTPADPTPAEMADADGVERPDAGDRRGLRALSAEDFSFAETIGGVRGLVESVAPGALFVVVFVITRELTPPLVAASVVALAAVVLRLVQRTPVTQALGGIFGVAIGVWWALRTGEPEDYLLPGLLINTAYLLICLVSILVRWPVVGIVVGLLRGHGAAWRQDRGLMRRADWATWVWVAMFGARLAVQVPAYVAGDVVWLGTARLAMGVPLWAFTLWLTWLLVRNPGPVEARRPAPADR